MPTTAPAGISLAGVFFCPLTGQRWAIKPVKHAAPRPVLPAPNVPAGDTLAEIREPRPAAQISSPTADDPTPGGRDP